MLLDGKATAEQIQAEIRDVIRQLPGRKPCLAVLLVGQHAPSQIYVNRKTQACEAVGMKSVKKQLSGHIREEDLLSEIEKLNADADIDGILVQLPLPLHINPFKIIEFIDPAKDVDGFHPTNVGKLLIGIHDGFLPCTPLGIKVLLDRYKIEQTGKHVLIVGRSNIVGKPLAAMMMQNSPQGNATVTVAHRYTQGLEQLSRLADILIVAIGQPKFITAEMVKEGAVVIDVGINMVDHPANPAKRKLVGDVDFELVKDKCSFITPVPGGVGPMTIAMLISNTLQSYLNKYSKK